MSIQGFDALPVAKGEVGAVVHGAAKHVLHNAGKLCGGQQLLHAEPCLAGQLIHQVSASQVKGMACRAPFTNMHRKACGADYSD